MQMSCICAPCNVRGRSCERMLRAQLDTAWPKQRDQDETGRSVETGNATTGKIRDTRPCAYLKDAKQSRDPMSSICLPLIVSVEARPSTWYRPGHLVYRSGLVVLVDRKSA